MIRFSIIVIPLLPFFYRPRWTSELNAYRIEAALKLGSWDKLDEALKHVSKPFFDIFCLRNTDIADKNDYINIFNNFCSFIHFIIY